MPRAKRDRKPYVLDEAALRLVGALARPLAIDWRAFGRSFSGGSPSVLEFGYDDDDDDEEDDDEEETKAGDVAIVRVSGPLAQRGQLDLCAVVDGYDWIGARLSAALASDAVAVVMVIDSPGGDGAGVVEGVKRMRAAVDAAGKPVLAYVDEWAASAAYWIAAGVADEVHVPETGAVGSIGVIAVHVDESRAYEAEGLRLTIVREPSGKAASSSLEPLGEVGKARVERSVRELAARFTADMAARRGLTEDAVRAFDADTFAGHAAVAVGLADQVSTFEQTIERARALAMKKETMAAIAAVLGVESGASEEELGKAAKEQAGALALGRKALELTGDAGAEAAEGTLRAWQTSHGKVAEHAAADAARAEADEKRERVDLLREAVKTGRILPAQAWADPTRGADGGPSEAFGEMKMKTLRAHLRALATLPAFKVATEATEATGATSPEDEEKARAAGVSVESYRAAKRRVQAASAAGRG